MKARQSQKILHYANGGTRHQYSRYWFPRLAFYGQQPVGWKDHRITAALKTCQRHGRCKHYLSHPEVLGV